jgi:hypothetical protein
VYEYIFSWVSLLPSNHVFPYVNCLRHETSYGDTLEASCIRQYPYLVFPPSLYHLKYQIAFFVPYYLKKQRTHNILNRERSESLPIWKTAGKVDSGSPKITEATPCGLTWLGLFPTTIFVLKSSESILAFLPMM